MLHASIFLFGSEDESVSPKFRADFRADYPRNELSLHPFTPKVQFKFLLCCVDFSALILRKIFSRMLHRYTDERAVLFCSFEIEIFFSLLFAFHIPHFLNLYAGSSICNLFLSLL
jgi:hypothetical protein